MKRGHGMKWNEKITPVYMNNKTLRNDIYICMSDSLYVNMYKIKWDKTNTIFM